MNTDEHGSDDAWQLALDRATSPDFRLVLDTHTVTSFSPTVFPAGRGSCSVG